MFNQTKLADIAKEHRASLRNLSYIEDALKSRYACADDAIEALVLSVACGEPLLFIGPPGTGKSQLIRDFCFLSGMDLAPDLANSDSIEVDYFEYLLTPFTEPSELFGFYDIPSLQEGKPKRLEKGMMQNAKVVYLDEVFHGSSAVLNSILTFMNERTFHERGTSKKVAMEYMFGATNDVPETGTLKAIFDRFLIRCHMANVQVNVRKKEKPFVELIRKGWWQTYGRPITSGATIGKNVDGEFKAYEGLISGLSEMRRDLKAAVVADPELRAQKESGVYEKFAILVKMARSYGLSEMSNRRIIKILWALCINKMYTAVRENIRTCATRTFKRKKEWDVLIEGESDPSGPFSAQDIIKGIQSGAINPMNMCRKKPGNGECECIKDAINFENDPMPNEIEIANKDLMLIPRFFLDKELNKEDSVFADKMERTLVNA